MKEVPAISIGVPIHQPERTRVEISDPADAGEFLEDAYGVNLRLFRKQAEQREGALLTHERISVGPLTIDEVFVAGELEARPDPLDKVVAVWVSNGRLSGTCDELHYEAHRGDIALVSQPHLPFSSCSFDLRATAVLLDPAFVAAVATGLPSTEAPLPLHFPSLLSVVPGAADVEERSHIRKRQRAGQRSDRHAVGAR